MSESPGFILMGSDVRRLASYRLPPVRLSKPLFCLLTGRLSTLPFRPFAGFGVMLTTVAGPTKYTSPVTNLPVRTLRSNFQVMPYCVRVSVVLSSAAAGAAGADGTAQPAAKSPAASVEVTDHARLVVVADHLVSGARVP